MEDFTAIDMFDIFAGDRHAEIVDNRLLVAEIDGHVVGYVSWLPGGFVGRDYITFLNVDPSHERRGIGRALLQAAEAAIGAGRVFVSTEDDNHAMLALLRVEGWIHAGAVAGANAGDRAEMFFYKDRPARAEEETS
ncbi:MAG: hypothetical protein A4S12_04910 [Proteobacteria bacterium SG_bin5]|nr:MAG: hypothetical protein A4S12_04910 [Proteobacteria bacterium SG_bin5]